MKPQSIFTFIAGSLTGIFLWMKFKPGKKVKDAESAPADSSSGGSSAPAPASDAPSITPTAGAGTTDSTDTVTPGAATPEVIHSIAAGEPTMNGGYPTEAYTEAPVQAPVGTLVPIAEAVGMSDTEPWMTAQIPEATLVPIVAVTADVATVPAESTATTSGGGGGTGVNGAKNAQPAER